MRPIHKRGRESLRLAAFIILAALAWGSQIPGAKKPFDQGEAAYARGSYAAAVEFYTLAIKADPSFAEAYRRRGSARNQLRQYDSAVADFSQAIRLKPGQADAYMGRGNARRDQKSVV